MSPVQNHRCCARIPTPLLLAGFRTCQGSAVRFPLLTVITADGSEAQIVAPLAFCEDHRDVDLDSILELDVGGGVTFWERTLAHFELANANVPVRDRTRLEMIGEGHPLMRQMASLQNEARH